MSENLQNTLTIQDMLLFQTVYQQANRLWQEQQFPGRARSTWGQALAEAHAAVTKDLQAFADLQSSSRSP